MSILIQDSLLFIFLPAPTPQRFPDTRTRDPPAPHEQTNAWRTFSTSCLHFSILSWSFLSCSGLRDGSALLLASLEMASFSSLHAAWWAFLAASTCSEKEALSTGHSAGFEDPGSVGSTCLQDSDHRDNGS